MVESFRTTCEPAMTFILQPWQLLLVQGYSGLLCLHVRLHVTWPAGGLSPDGQRWVFLPRRVLRCLQTGCETNFAHGSL